MKELIIPRGASPRLYRKLVLAGEVKGQYREIDDQAGVQAAIDTVVIDKPKVTPKPRKRKPRQLTGYQEGDRGYDDAWR